MASEPRRRLAQRLFEPVDIAPLVFFRIVFGAVMLWEVCRFFARGWIARYYTEPQFFFKYYGFEWVRPWPGNGMYLHFYALGGLAICLILGFCYRPAAALFFLGISYVFLLDMTNYLNHMYLICLLSFLMIFVPAHRALSVDAALRLALRSDTAPAWTLWLLRFQIAVPYFFGGVAKVNADWLAGEPMRAWLAERQDFPVLGRFFDEEWMVYAMSWGGLAFDLFVVPLLLWRRTRLPAFAAAILFHLLNARLFQIGVFPWLMLGASLIFFPPETFRPWRRRGAVAPVATAELPRALPAGRRAILASLALYAAVQVLLPLRHWLYPGQVGWTEEGHNFSWHMKLRDKDARVVFYVRHEGAAAPRLVKPDGYLSTRQARKMSTRPDMILQFAWYLADRERAAGRRNITVHAVVRASLNGRPLQFLVDPQVDLASQPRSLAPAHWIVPLRERER